MSLARGEYTTAAAYALESASIARSLHHELDLGTSLLNLGLASLRLGRRADAAAAYDEALEIFETMSYAEGAVYAFIGLAALAADSADQRDAALVLGAADAALNEVGAVLEPAERPLRTETLERLGSALGSEPLEAQLAEGAGLPFSEAIGIARRLAAHVVAGDSPPANPGR